MNLVPIGRIESPFQRATGTPVQPCRAQGVQGRVEVFPEYALGLADLGGFERIWLLFWCDRAAEPKLTVIPYRTTTSHGLFATRAPARPNPIGMSCVKLVKVSGRFLEIEELDILDGTPLIDIKPYLPQYDNYPVSRCGWVDGLPDVPVVADQRFERQDPR
jgi:tRNA-Thr(GGU) m(6)t(6)A37 methyltransferase TsaA